MRGLFVVICMIVSTVLAVTTPQTSRAAVRPSYPFVVEFKPSSPLSMDEPITMTLQIKPRTSTLQIMSGDDCGDTVAIELIGDRGLQALGANAMTGTFGADSTYTTSFDVILPPDDTSSITVWLRSSVRKMKTQRWFVTTADTVEYWHGNPREYLYSARPRSEYEPPKIKLNERAELPDSTLRGSLVPAPPAMERQLADMRTLEKEPLTDAQVQYHNVGKELYRRLEGEKEFTLVVRKSAEELRAEKQAYLDSLAGLPPNAKVRVCLNLRGDHLQFVKEMVGPLPTPESESYYHLTVTKELLEQLKEKGVPIMYLDLEDRVHRPHPSDQPPPPVPSDPQGHDSASRSKDLPREELWREEFDSGWKSRWQEWDNDPGCGYDGWDNSTWWGGSKIWCAGYYQNQEGGSYDCGQLSILQSNFIDLSAYPNHSYPYFVWSFWYDIDPEPSNWDNLMIEYSYDFSYWFFDRTIRGSSSGWVTDSTWVGNHGGLYIRYSFQSHPYQRNARGVYFDDVWVTGIPPTWVNLTAGMPSGWDDSIVVSPVPFTHSDGTVYQNEPIYIDWAILNEGTEDATYVTSDVLLDGDPIFSNYVSLLPANNYYMWEDLDLNEITTISPGEHTLTIVVDSTNVHDESDETDNRWSRTFYVEPATVMFYGYLQYVDLDPPSEIVPMKNIRISMWDEVDLWWDDSLAGDVTNNSGYFELGPVDNVDNKGDKQDIYLKISAENDACFVTDGVDGDIYYIQTDTWQETPSGEHYRNITATTTESGRYFVADRMLECFRWWMDSVGGTAPVRVEVGLSPDGQTSHYNSTHQHIHIESSVYPDSFWPDTFDEDIISHEYAHWIEDELDFFTKNFGGQHAWDEITGIYSACSEGFADFFSGLVKQDSIFRFYRNDFLDSSWYNLENGIWGFNNDTDAYSPNSTGPEFEAGVATLLWDIYDNVNDDFGTPLYYYSDPNPDGVWDSLSDGIDNMMTALLYREVDGHHPDTLGDFWLAWFQPEPLGHRKKMGDIWYEHGDTTKQTCCKGTIRGNFDYSDPDVDESVHGIDICDLVALVDYMFTGGIAPVCFAEANVDGSDGNGDGDDTPADIDISDLVMLVDYMFTGGPEPLPC